MNEQEFINEATQVFEFLLDEKEQEKQTGIFNEIFNQQFGGDDERQRT